MGPPVVLHLSACASQNDCGAAMLGRQACLDSACGMFCFLMQEPVWGSNKSKNSAGAPSPAPFLTPTRKYGRTWDELTPVSKMLGTWPDRVPAHLLPTWVPSQVLDSGTPLGRSAQPFRKLPTASWVWWVPAGPTAVSEHSKHGTWGCGAADSC